MRARAAAILSLLVVGCATAPAPPAGSPGADDPVAAGKRWRDLTRAKEANEARSLCTPWLTAASKLTLAGSTKGTASGTQMYSA